MDVERFFYEHPVFRLDELAKWKVRHGAHSKRAINALVQHYLKSRRLLRIRRELYAVVPPNDQPETMLVDPYIVASKLSSNSVLAYHTALELHAVAYSPFNIFTSLNEGKIKSFYFQNHLFQSISFPINLRKSNNNVFGVETFNRQGLAIQITNVSRTFVDVLDRLDISGGWEEVVRSLSNIAVLNTEQVIEYCLILKNAALAAKVGYFLEQRQGAFAPSPELLRPLLKNIPARPQYLSRTQHEPCRLIKKWNIMLPISVINKSWEESDDDL